MRPATTVWQTVNSVKNLRNLPISNPKPDLHNSNAHLKFGKNLLIFTQVIIQKQKYKRMVDKQQTDGWTGRYENDQHETIIPWHYHAVE